MSQGQGFGFGLGKMKELADAVKKAQQIQEGAKQLQEDLEAMEIEGQSGGGLVKVFVSGNQEPRRVEISPDAMVSTHTRSYPTTRIQRSSGLFAR